MKRGHAQCPWLWRARMGRGCSAAVVACALLGCGSGEDGQQFNQTATPPAQVDTALPIAPGVSTSVQLGGRRFLLYVPSSLASSSTAAVPLVLMLHGYGATPEQTQAYDTLFRWNELAESEYFIVAYPASDGPAWNACGGSDADLQFLDRLVQAVAAAYPIDRKRIFAAGHSQGGLMAVRLALDRGATVSAVMANAAPAAACGAGGAPVPVMLSYGTADPLVPYASNAQAMLDFWLAHNLPHDRLSDPPAVLLLADKVPEDLSTIEQSLYTAQAGSADVQFWRVNGAGHAWPNPTAYSPALQAQFGRRNQDVDGADAAWAFFKRHPLP